MKSERICFNFPALETERLTFRQIRQEDVDSVFAYKSDPPDSTFPRVERHTDQRTTQVFIQDCLKAYYQQRGITWVLCLRGTDSPIGHVSISSMERADQVQPHRAEISCFLARQHRRTGIMFEARCRIISFYFDKHPGLIRLHSEVATNNSPSLKMNEKLGFKLDGVLRQYEKAESGYQDIAVLSLLQSDYLQHPAYTQYRAGS